MTEVLQPSLSCVHGLRLQVFCRRHMSSNGLVCHARFGKSMARRFEDREDMTAGNSRRCRFTLAVPCIRRHFGCQKKTRKRKWIKRTCPFCTSKYKRSAHGDGGVTCDIVVVVGFSLLVPFLKWAYAHQAGSRFQNEVTVISLKNR